MSTLHVNLDDFPMHWRRSFIHCRRAKLIYAAFVLAVMSSQGHTQRNKKRKPAPSTPSSNNASRHTTNARLPARAAVEQDVFHGLRICLTGHWDKRAHIAECVKQFGGKWSPGRRRDVDILIAEHADGDKYAWARKWGVEVVSRGWYMASMARGFAVGVERY
ncbi:hypothetical protein EJ03DRAFT_148141 [Teratosphaeria nubilosa]|uniref:BRCT domain-containing protein n=1 Tax=Teratosphaeria nubilosa TaxID=161662 RepID=A0A6G1L430_9PEZI|nr:hypothetical protein EJ03DRAFT_148141 [Teratosphaeria nubilosa]